MERKRNAKKIWIECVTIEMKGKGVNEAKLIAIYRRTKRVAMTPMSWKQGKGMIL